MPNRQHSETLTSRSLRRHAGSDASGYAETTPRRQEGSSRSETCTGAVDEGGCGLLAGRQISRDPDLRVGTLVPTREIACQKRRSDRKQRR